MARVRNSARQPSTSTIKLVPTTLVIFAATYVVIAIGRLPGLRLDRAGAALCPLQPPGTEKKP